MKTFFLDIDGVIYKDGIINESVLKEIKNKHAKYIFCTGRGYLRCLDIVKKYIDKDNEIILENGGQIIKNNTKIYYNEIPQNIKEILEKLPETVVEYIIFAVKEKDTYYSYGKDGLLHIKKNYKRYSAFLKLLYRSNLCQITIKFKNIDSQNKFFKTCQEKNIEYKLSEDYIIINNKGVNKKNAIAFLIKKNNLKLSDCIIVGNDYNDITMFDINCYKKIGVIDNNTPNEIKEKATDLISFENLSQLIKMII